MTVTLNASIDTTLPIATLEAGRRYRVRDVVRLAGGKGVNVARVLRRLGVGAHATGLAGGVAADFIRHGLEGEGIPAHFLPIAGSSRTCHAVVELEHQRVTELDEVGPEVTPDEAAAFRAFFKGALAGTRLVVLSGSLPPGLSGDYYASLLAHAHAAGVPAVLDTSGTALAHAIAARPLLVKPNAGEAGDALGRRVDTVDDAQRAGGRLHAMGARLAAVSLGAAGAVLATAAGAWWAGTDVQRPVSTVGCGDAFVGGFVAALCGAVDRGDYTSIEEASTHRGVLTDALVLATACGAANTRLLGAGILESADVASCRQTVRIRELL